MADNPRDKKTTDTSIERPPRRTPQSRSNSPRFRDAGTPFDMMQGFYRDMDNMFAGSPWNFPRSFGEWLPHVEAFQRGNEFVVRADLPGLKPEDVDVEVSDETITIRGERKDEHEEDHEGYYRSERHYGSFHRAIPVPQGAIADSAKADFKNGVLEIRLQAPPADVRRGRKIKIGEPTPS